MGAAWRGPVPVEAAGTLVASEFLRIVQDLLTFAVRENTIMTRLCTRGSPMTPNPALNSPLLGVLTRLAALVPLRAFSNVTALANIALGFLALTVSACAWMGPHSLRADQVNYGEALGEAKKREILSMIVGLRYADAPAFLTVSQIIAGYTFTATGGLTANSLPDPGGAAAQATGMVSYSNHPTYTFTPTTGDEFAKAYIQPLSPALILPLADSGIPIDLLLRITVQTLGGLNNATMLGGPEGNGSAGFFEILLALRRLQLAGEAAIEFVKNSNSSRVRLAIGRQQGPEPPEHVADVERVRTLLNLTPDASGYEIISDGAAVGTRQISIRTRSILAILTDLGAEITVPGQDVESGATKASIGLVGGETRPIVIIHAAKKITGAAYAAVAYHSATFWVDDADFDSKYALTVLQDLMALAEVTDTAHAPLVTVPAG